MDELAFEYAFLISCLKASYRPIGGQGDAIYKKIERDEFARNYLGGESAAIGSPTMLPAAGGPRPASGAKSGREAKVSSKEASEVAKEDAHGERKYRRAPSQLYQWISNLF